MFYIPSRATQLEIVASDPYDLGFAGRLARRIAGLRPQLFLSAASTTCLDTTGLTEGNLRHDSLPTISGLAQVNLPSGFMEAAFQELPASQASPRVPRYVYAHSRRN